MDNNKVMYQGTGRRKDSVAQVILTPGTGKIMMNGKEASDYFPFASLIKDLNQPFDVTSTAGTFDARVNVHGGGFSGQAGATRHGIARALLQVDPDRCYINVYKASTFSWVSFFVEIPTRVSTESPRLFLFKLS